MGLSTVTNFIMCFAVLSISFVEIIGLNDENDLRLTLAEKNGLKELKSQVSGEIKEDFMNTEFYLIRWLRKANLNVQTAKKLLLQNISWRDQNNISNILNEDFTDLEEDYHLQLNGTDKKGRPVVEIDFGDWDLRAAALQGNMRRLHRYLGSYTERCIKAIFAAQAQGKPVTRYVVLFDLSGANLVQQICPICLSFLVRWVAEFDRFYPNFTEEDIFINAPPVARVGLNAVRAVSSPDLNSRIIVFDTNKSSWMNYLDARIDKDQRSPRFGGTAARA